MAAHKDKSKENEVKIDPNAWMTTFSDLLMLLLTFFVMLLTMKSMDTGKVREVFDSLIQTTGPLEFLDQRRSIAALGEDGRNARPLQVLNPDMLEKAIDLLDGIDQLPVNDHERTNLRDFIEIKEDRRGIIISLESDHLFDSGEAEVRYDRLATLDAVGSVLRYAANDILIMGHTDNRPIRGGKFESNRELSFYRALSVLFYMVDSYGLKRERLAAGGYGDIMPRYANDSVEHRAKNRRVEFILRKRK